MAAGKEGGPAGSLAGRATGRWLGHGAALLAEKRQLSHRETTGGRPRVVG